MSVDSSWDPATWIDRHGDVLFRYALLRLRDEHRAEDAVQETLLAALAGRKPDASPTSERAWLVGILRHKIADCFRRAARERTEPGPDPESPGTEIKDFFNHAGIWKSKPRRWSTRPDGTIERREFWEVLHQCMSRMPDRLAEVFALRELQELATEDVRQILRVSPGNLSTLMHRARLSLRRCLELNWFGSSSIRRK